MKNNETRFSRLLAIDPCTRGFGFAVLELNGRLVDWGVSELSGVGTAEGLTRVAHLIDRYTIRALATEDVGSARRGNHTRLLLKELGNYAELHHIPRHEVSAAAIRQSVGLKLRSSKHELAIAMAETFPELREMLPAKRKPWQSEDARMNIFDAIGTGLAVLRREWGGRD